MKKSFCFFVLCTFLFIGYSCSSDDNVIDTSSSEELHEIKLNISTFSSEISDMSTRSSLVDSKVKYLRYVVLNKDVAYRDEVVEEKNLEAADLASPLTLKLRKGNYILCFFASEKPITSERIKADHSSLQGNMNFVDVVDIADFSNPNQYHATVDIQVTDADIQKSIELKRTVGKVSLAISDLDKAPSTVQTLIPILVEASLSTGSWSWSYYTTPYCLIMKDGATTFSPFGSPLVGAEIFSSICIKRDKFSTINEATPFVFYLPQTINVNTSVVPIYSGDRRYDLYLQGVKSDKLESQHIGLWESPQSVIDEELKYNPDAINKNVVFLTCIKRGIVIKGNEEIIIKGNLFKDSQLSITINDTWGETTNTNF